MHLASQRAKLSTAVEAPRPASRQSPARPRHAPRPGLGHSLSAIPVAPGSAVERLGEHAEAPQQQPRPAAAAAAVPAFAVPVRPAAPIQLARDWKKILAGVGAGLGAGALIAGGILASPALAVAGGVGLLTGGGYLAKRAYDRRRETRRRERDLGEATAAIRRGIGGEYGADDTSRPAVLSRLLTEASGHLDNPRTRVVPTTGRGELAFSAGPLDQRNYEIRVNPDDPLEFGRDPAQTRSTVLHELTHVAVDRGYTANRDRAQGDFPANRHAEEDYWTRAEANLNSLEGLRGTLDNDESIDDPAERRFIHSRINYAASSLNPAMEHDTVVSELVYYLHQKGVPEHSATSREVTRLAHEAYQRRNRRG